MTPNQLRCRLLGTGLMLVLSVACGAQAQTQSPNQSMAERDARIAWWREGRLGLFIHWGPVSLKGTEISWSRANSNPKCPNKGEIPIEVYDNLYRDFNPTRFDAAEWIRVAKAGGMKYVVLTAKHCDSFLLWHSQTSDYNMAATPFRRDICAELTDAAHRENMKIGWYFSPMDWRDPDFRTQRNAAFLGRMQAELREVLGRYGRIDLLWFDWDGGEPLYDQPATYAIVKQLQPDIVVNNRLDLSPRDTNRKILSSFADYYTPEQELGSYDDQQPWETCMTLGTQWAWKPDDKIKSVPEAVGILASCAGGDGNLLLNVGPMPDGRIEPRQVAVLEGIGQWLATHGESIYGTRGGPWKPNGQLASTRRGNVVYLHVLRWSGESIVLPSLGKRIKSSSLLSGGTVELQQGEQEIRIRVAPADRREIDTVVKLELEGSAGDIAPISLAVAANKTPER